MHSWCQSTQDYQRPHFAHLLTLWLAPSFLHAQIDTWCRGRQTGGLFALRLQRCGPAVSRLIQSNLPLSQAGTPGCFPSSSRLEAQQTTQPSSAPCTANREGSPSLVKSLLTVPHKSSSALWWHTPKDFWLCWKNNILVILSLYQLIHVWCYWQAQIHSSLGWMFYKFLIFNAAFELCIWDWVMLRQTFSNTFKTGCTRSHLFFTFHDTSLSAVIKNIMKYFWLDIFLHFGNLLLVCISDHFRASSWILSKFQLIWIEIKE